MDYSTIVTSALLSVVLSVIVASRVAMRQERGKARQQAHDRLRALVDPKWREARQVELHMSKPGRRPDVLHTDDFIFASNVLAVARELPAWRRWLIRRRLIRLVGRMWVDQFEVRPMTEDSLGSVIAPILSAQYRESQTQQYSPRDQQGIYGTALVEGSTLKQARTLRRHLGLLGRGL